MISQRGGHFADFTPPPVKPSASRGGAGGTAARPPESTQRICSPSASILPFPENASSLALTLQIKRSFQRRESFVVVERVHPALGAHGPFAGGQGHPLCLLVTASLSFIQACVFIFQPAHRKGLVSSSISAGARLAIVASGRFSASTEPASASPCLLVS